MKSIVKAASGAARLHWLFWLWVYRTIRRILRLLFVAAPRSAAFAAIGFILRRLEFEAWRIADSYAKENTTLQRQLKHTREDHKREMSCLNDEIAVKDKNIRLLAMVNARDLARVEAEIACHTRRKQEASASPQGVTSGGMDELYQ